MKTDISTVASAALPQAESLAQSWLPDGRREGNEWVARNPTRKDRRPGSFKVNLTSGQWCDWASDDKGGDLVSLYALLNGTDQLAAARAVASEIKLDVSGVSPPPASRQGCTIQLITPIPPGSGKAPPHARLGSPDARWTYRDKNGQPLMYACRFNGDDGHKDVLPLSYGRKDGSPPSWIWKSLPVPRPPYGLDRLACRPEAPVLVAEGEKAADAAGKLFPDFVAVTSSGGSNSAGKTDWSPLAGRRVVISPDADDPGDHYATEVVELVRDAGAAEVEKLEWPHEGDPPAGWDLADALEAGWTAERVSGLGEGIFVPFEPKCRRLSPVSPVANTEIEPQPESPLPLRRTPPPAREYPVESLGGILGTVAMAIHEKVQASTAICGQSVLGAATLTVQGHANVVLPTGTARPLSCFFMSVAASGDRKTTTDGLALLPIRRREKELKEKHGDDSRRFYNASQAYESKRKKIVAKVKDIATTTAELNALGPPPESPLNPLLTCPEPTFEGLSHLLQEGQPSIGLFSSEGGQFIGGHALNQENKLKTAAGLSGLWDGDPVKRVRRGDGTIMLYGRRVSLHIMVQPGVASELLSDPILQDQGLLSRILVTYPDSLAGTRLWKEVDGAAGQAIDRYCEILEKILRRDPPVADGKQNELVPRRIELSPDARQRWIEFSDSVENRLVEDGEYSQIRPFASKMAEHAARIAAVLTLVENLESPDVPDYQMERGILLSEYYASELLRLESVGSTDPDILLAERLLEWIKNRKEEGPVPLREIYRSGPRRIRDAKTARRIVQILEEHGYLFKVEEPSSRRKELWKIVREPLVEAA